MRSIHKYFVIIAFALLPWVMPSHAGSQVMADYTAYPPFITGGATPNLLLMFDNSASMLDMNYVDNGSLPARQSSYCYDNTYISTTTYTGYFENNTIYTYDDTNQRFIELSALPSSCSHKISGELCIDIVSGTPNTVNTFAVKGNYLNWLTASKLDVQKQILTGGKYDATTNEYIAESRGCVGRSFVKEALQSDYVEGGTNTSLGITLAVSGPPNEENPSGLSRGGQTSIEIFLGDYNEDLCQTAAQTIIDANNPSAIRKAVEDCLSYDPHGTGTQYCLLDAAQSCSVDSDCDTVGDLGDCSTGKKSDRVCLAPTSMSGQSCVNDSDCNTVASSVGPCVGGSTHSAAVTTKIVFNQSMQECWQIWSGKKTVIGNDAWSGEAPKCADVYGGYQTCTGGDNAGNSCTSDAQCPGGGTCDGGPSAISAGNPALMCSSSYTGYCATTTDDWATTTWSAQEYTSEQECFLSKYLEYCNSIIVSDVTDPSDAPDDPAETAGVPAIIADIGVEAQLGDSILTATVKRYDTTAPTGLINDYNEKIRFGAMQFNFEGSSSECNLSSSDSLKCPKVCSYSTKLSCSTDVDCPDTETCEPVSSFLDGGELIHFIGEGTCSVTTSEICLRDDQCPTDETCVPDVGDHSTGLIKAIDEITANAWTPFAESYYNAISYFVKDATADNPNLDPADFSASTDAIQLPLNINDLEDDDDDNNYPEPGGSRNPIEYRCQSNNILLISDGSPTADLNATITTKIKDASNYFNDVDGTDPASCGNFSGSSYLDDLSYFSNNRNIFNPAEKITKESEVAQNINTYVVYTGTETSTETGECAPLTLMTNTAINGGTEIYTPEPNDSTALSESIKNAFQQVASDTASGTAVSVLATTGAGEGAVFQAFFFPEKEEDNQEDRKWLGSLHSLFVDKYGNLREDTDLDDILDLKKYY